MKLITEVSYEPLSLLTEADSSGEKHLYLKGPMAVSEVTNKNGRIYPKSLLEKVVDKYNTDYIKTNRALGELNHPCFEPGAKVFVQNKGLIPIEDVIEGDYVYGTTDGKSKSSRVTSTSKTHFDGELLNFESRSFRATVTPYHRFHIVDRHGDWGVTTAKDILEDFESGKRTLSHSYIPKTLENWEQSSDNFITFEVKTHRKENGQTLSTDALTLNMKDFCAFMGIYLSEGSVKYSTRVDGSRLPGEISIAQNLGTNMDLILDLVSRMGFERTTLRINDSIKANVCISDARMSDYLSQFGDCYNKFIPDVVLNSSKENIAEFLTWFNLGDGDCVSRKVHLKNGKTGEYTKSSVFTVSERLANGLIECIVKTGKSTTKRIQISPADYEFADRTIKIENKVPLYRMTIGTSVGKYIDDRFTKITKKPYSGFVYCLTTETDNFLVEQHGTVFLSGNCSRLSVDYERATHLVTEMTQDGNVWVGKARILKTPMGQIIEGLCRSGVNIGMSTRCGGSIVERSGNKYVHDDYIMTAIDAVSDPSGQYLGGDGSMQGCFVNGILEGVEFTQTSDGKWLQHDIMLEAKKAYDRKKLDSETKLKLMSKFINGLAGKLE